MSTIRITPPDGDLNAVIRVPGSKSVANRALVCAMLANGESTISGIPDGDDTAVILHVLREVSRLHELRPDTFVVAGDPQGRLPHIIDAQLAGTSSRFLTSVAALSSDTRIIDGGAPLRARPMNDLHLALQQMGAEITPLGDIGHLPISVARGMCRGGQVSIRGDVSSQFISALMLIGPVLEEGMSIRIEGPLVSRSYVEMTATVMRAFGADVHIGVSEISVRSTGYVASDYVVEPDFSSAAFPLVASVLRHGVVRIPHLGMSTMQGDSEVLTILRSIGLDVEQTTTDVIVRHTPGTRLHPISFDMSDCSDLVPAVAVACTAIDGMSTISGVGFIRHKESDRLGDLAAELTKCGADVRVEDDGLTIAGGRPLVDAVFETHHDHRLAMALSLCSLTSGASSVQNYEVVSKSWPSFFDDLAPILGPVVVGN